MNCNQITFIRNKPLCVFCELFALFYVLVRILWLTIWENEKGLWNVMGNFAIRIKTPIVLVRRVNKKKGHPWKMSFLWRALWLVCDKEG